MKQLHLRMPLVLATALFTSAGLAQSWPAKPVRVIVPQPAGGGIDTVARTISQKLSESFKQPFVVDNRAGAAGIIGADFVAKAPKDGYTLLVASTTLPITAVQ